MSTPQDPAAPLKVGILLFPVGTQLLDLAAIDLLGMLTPEYHELMGLPENIPVGARALEFHYIADVVKGEGPIPMYMPVTASGNVRITDTLDSIDNLDILFIPGPPLSYVPSASTIAFIQKQTASARAVLIVCSGILPAAFSGILTGKRATAPLVLLPTLREKLPDVQWVTKRWTVDEERKIWTSGAVLNGTDMMAAFVKEFAPQVGALVSAIADVGERGDEYSEEQLKMKFYQTDL